MRQTSWMVIVVGALSLAGLTGCDLFEDGGETGSSELKRFSSEQEFGDYMRNQMTARNSSVVGFDRADLESDGAQGDAGGGPTAAPEAPGGSQNATGGDLDDDFSGTTIQEAGVDEADVVKTDGNYLYLLDYNYDGSGTVLRIIDVTQPAAMASVGEAVVEGYGQELYLHGDKVVALTSGGGGFYYFGGGGGIGIEPLPVDIGMSEGGSSGSAGAAEGEAVEGDVKPDDPVSSDGMVEPGTNDPDPDADGGGDDGNTGGDDVFIDPYISYERPRTIVTVIDVTDPHAPVVQSTTKFDGYQSSSRLIDGALHLVVANYQDYYIDILPLLGRPEFAPADVDPETVVPRYTRINADGSETSGEVVTWESLYHPTDPDGFGIVYVASVDIDADASFTAVGVVAEPGLIYSSREALYLTDTNYDFLGDQRETTDLYKFEYTGRGAAPVATGTVPGRVLNQYSMGENNGHLRVATTVGPTFSQDGTTSVSTNNVYVLGQVGGSLDITGRVENVAPRESIQAARFIGDRGYLVTFEQIDPLFTLDLSDPTNPKIVGELKVPGFSTFLVPIDDDHLLAVGQYVPPPGEFGAWGVQLSIFDVTDFANPTLMDNVVIGDDTGAYSEALYNPKALTYYAQRGVLALPISIYDNQIIFIDGGGEDIDFDADGSGAGTSSGSAGTTRDEPVADEPASPPSDGVEGEPGIDVPDDIYVPGGFEGLVIYNVSAESGFSELGRISTRFEDAGFYWASFTRGVFVKEDVLAVTDHGVRGAPVTDVTNSSFELLFDDAVNAEEPPTVVDGAEGESSPTEATKE